MRTLVLATLSLVLAGPLPAQITCSEFLQLPAGHRVVYVGGLVDGAYGASLRAETIVQDGDSILRKTARSGEGDSENTRAMAQALDVSHALVDQLQSELATGLTWGEVSDHLYAYCQRPEWEHTKIPDILFTVLLQVSRR